MLLFEDPHYIWRETYFVLCEAARRPGLAVIERELRKALPRLVMRAGEADADGRFVHLGLVSDENHSGVDILWAEGKAVRSEIVGLIDELEKHAKPKERVKLDRARTATAKIELLHYERIDRPPARAEPAGTVSGDCGRFAFDPERYMELPSGLDTEGNDTDDFPFEEFDSAVLMPDTLIIAMEIARRITDGIAVDAAGGTVL